MNVEINPSEYKILVVDDILSNVILLQVFLKKEGYKIATASNGEECLNKLDSEIPDLILLDVMMPGLNGYDVARIIRTEQKYSDIPIIFLTALNEVNDVVKGFEAGANDFLSKPFDKEELLIRITHQISIVAKNRIIAKQTEDLRNTIIGRDKLYSVIAHDLRSPLGSIKMVLNMLSISVTKEQIGEELYDLISTANKTTESTFSLLDNLLKWTKNQIGRLEVVYQESDISSVVSCVVENFMLIAQVKGISLKLVDSCIGLKIRADLDMLKTVMRNLLSNAIKYSNEGSLIVVSLEDSGDYIHVHVADSGMGIKDEDKGKLLKMDECFTTYGTANEEGSGLGLLLVNDFVQKNGGKLWFESTYGKGSTFSFSVPKVKD